jgi:hypothetical protein
MARATAHLLTRDEIIKALGEFDDSVVADLVSMGVTAEELAQARAWVENNEVLVNSGKPLPSGRVGELVELLTTIEVEATDAVAGRN